MQPKTTADWLYRKKLITSDELVAGRALALLLEYRWTSVWPEDSTVIYFRKFLMARPYQMATEVAVDGDTEMSADDGQTKATSLEEVLVPEKNVSDAVRRERLINSRDELLRIYGLFKRALPECPDLFVRLGRAVTERITVHELAYRDVPLLCAALYVLKEHWRYDLLEDLIDEAVELLNRSTKRPEDLPGRTRGDSSPAQYFSAESLSELFGGDVPEESAELSPALSNAIRCQLDHMPDAVLCSNQDEQLRCCSTSPRR